MIKIWTLNILTISTLLMVLLKEHETRTLNKFYQHESYIHLSQFKEAKAGLSIQDLELMELWESIITGRSAPVSRWMKEQYAQLGLKHLFTPSGFHLSSLTSPLFYFFKNHKFKIFFLTILTLGTFIFNMPSALKRMSLVKLNQKIFGIYSGFILALIADLLTGGLGSFLSFTYSFLFLGIVYSGEKKIYIIFLFFLSQTIICFTQELFISPLILIFSPLLNILFSLIMPILFALSWPLNDWQVSVGLFILRILQNFVGFTANILENVPQFLPNPIIMLIFLGILMAKKRLIIICLLICSNGLNLELGKFPGISRYEFVPNKSILKTTENKTYYQDGICKHELVRGFWWERCSPYNRRSKKNKYLKKLSYL